MPGLGLFNCVSSLRKKIRKRTNIPITLPPKFLARPAQHRENETCTSGATAGSSVRLEDVLNYDEVLVHFHPQWKQDVSAQRQVSKHGIQCSDQESNYTSEDDEKTDEELEEYMTTCPPLDEYSGNRYLRRDHMLHVNLIDPMAAEKTEIPVQILFKVIPTSIMLDKTLRINIVVYPKSKADRSDDVFGHYVQELVNLDLPEKFSVSVNGVRDGWKLMSGVNQECPIQPDAISNISFNLRNSDHSSTGSFSVDFDIYGTQPNRKVTIAGTIYQWITDERERSLMYPVVSPPVQPNAAKPANRTRGHKTRGSRRRKPKSSACVVDSSTSDTNSNSPRGNDNQAVTKPKALIGAKLSYTTPKALVANVKSGSDIPSDLKLHSLHFSDSSNDNTKRIVSSDMCFTLESA